MALYLVPATEENLRRSIDNTVGMNELARFLSRRELDEIEARSMGRGAHCWAMTTTKRGAFDAMAPGDDVLLSEKGTKRFTRHAQVTFKVENRALGEHIWPYKGDKPWELIYFLGNVRGISVVKQDLVVKLGYASNFDVAGTTRVRDELLERFEKEHGTIAQWLGFAPDREELSAPPEGPASVDEASARDPGNEARARDARGQGYEADPAVRRAVELRAMTLAEAHYRELGFEVKDTSATQPYDLRCTKNGAEVRVEVKGTRGGGSTVEVTIGEVENARATGWRTDLFVVSGIEVTQGVEGVVSQGGVARKIEGWKPAVDELAPIRFRCTVPATPPAIR